MSFSISDFVALPQFAWHVYTALRNAPKDYIALSNDVLILRDVLTTTEENIRKTRGLKSAEARLLNDITSGCKCALDEVDTLLKRCSPANRGVPWGRIKLAAEDTRRASSQISAQLAKLDTFNGLLILSAQNRQEEKLDRVIAKLERRGLIISVENVASVLDGDQGWKTFGRALENKGITLQMAQDRHHSLFRLLTARVEVEQYVVDGEDATDSHRAFQHLFGDEGDEESAQSNFDRRSAEKQRETVNKGHVVTGIIGKIQSHPLSESDPSKKSTSSFKRLTHSNSSSSSIVSRDINFPVSGHRLDDANFQAAIEDISGAKSSQSLNKDCCSSNFNMSVQYNPLDFENVLKLHPATCFANTMYGQAQKMALRFAAFFGTVELLMILLCSNTEIDARTVSGKVPLHIAIYGDKASVVKKLLCNNINISYRDLRDWLLLHSDSKGSVTRPSISSPAVTSSNRLDCGDSYITAPSDNADIFDTQSSAIAIDWLDDHGHDLSALRRTTTCSSSDANKAASCVVEYWHDQGICQILPARCPKSQNPLRKAVGMRSQRAQSKRPRPNQDANIHLPGPKPERTCHRCSSLLGPMEEAIVQSWSSRQTCASLDRSHISPGLTALTTALDFHSKHLLNELTIHGSKILAAEQMKAKFEGLGLLN